MCALGCRCARHIFRQWQKECCHGNGILWQKWGENLASRTTSSVFHQFSWNLAQMFALGCRCARHIFFWQWLKVCCHGNGILWQNWGKNLASRTTSSVFHPFSWNLAQMFALGCRCARHIFFDSGRKCVAMVTAYYGKNGGKNLASRTTSSVFHQFSWNLAQMFALGCRCARHIFFDSGRKCVAMVTAYYGKNGGKILRRELLPQFFTNCH